MIKHQKSGRMSLLMQLLQNTIENSWHTHLSPSQSSLLQRINILFLLLLFISLSPFLLLSICHHCYCHWHHFQIACCPCCCHWLVSLFYFGCYDIATSSYHCLQKKDEKEKIKPWENTMQGCDAKAKQSNKESKWWSMMREICYHMAL